MQCLERSRVAELQALAAQLQAALSKAGTRMQTQGVVALLAQRSGVACRCCL